MNIIIGNVLGLMASLAMVYSGIVKEKKKILYVQSIQILLFALCDFVLGGIVGAIINLINLIRNILCYNDKLDIKKIIIITIVSIAFSLYFNNLGFIGLMPLISSVLYLCFMNVKDVRKFKLLIIIVTLLWLIYDFYIKAYTSSIFDFLTVCTNIYSLFKLRKNR